MGASFSRFRGLRFRDRVLCFRVLGASSSRFGCFVLRSSFPKLPDLESEPYLIACIYTLETRNFGLDLSDFTRAVEEM